MKYIHTRPPRKSWMCGGGSIPAIASAPFPIHAQPAMPACLPPSFELWPLACSCTALWLSPPPFRCLHPQPQSTTRSALSPARCCTALQMSIIAQAVASNIGVPASQVRDWGDGWGRGLKCPSFMPPFMPPFHPPPPLHVPIPPCFTPKHPVWGCSIAVITALHTSSIHT